MNRQQRRAAQKAVPAYRRGMTREDKRKALIQNGITPEDLEQAAQDGYKQGWKAACDYSMRVCYAASVLALHDLEGYGQRRNVRFLRRMDSIVTNTLSSDEAIEQALERAGVEINFREPLERVMEA